MTVDKAGRNMYWNITPTGKMKRVKAYDVSKNVGACPWVKQLRKDANGKVTQSQIKEIKNMKVKKPVSLSQTLKNTTQPAKRATLKEQMTRANEGRGSKTRGWAAEAPQRGSERHKLLANCGSKCFLQPGREAFPICPKCKGNSCSCSIDCRGVLSAKIRANQWKYPQVAKMANEIGRTKCKGFTNVWA